MDQRAREVIIALIERLKGMERTCIDDTASVNALIKVLCTGNPEFLERYRAEKENYEKKLSTSPSLALDGVYDGLIQLLSDSKNQGPQGPIH